MPMFSTKAIVLRRTNYGEADRIMQILTPDRGKLSGIAKGVRRGKSRLAGGLELFAVSDVTLIEGRTDLHIITAATIDTFYSHILQDYDRLQFGYTCIKEINRIVEMSAEPEYFELLRQVFENLNDLDINIALIEVWFRLQLADLMGGGLNLKTDSENQKLQSDARYDFIPHDMEFVEKEKGQFGAEHIKLLRLLLTKNPRIVNNVGGIQGLMGDILWLSRNLSERPF
jgi:DNA repair protein RecO (recombination protein O)